MFAIHISDRELVHRCMENFYDSIMTHNTIKKKTDIS